MLPQQTGVHAGAVIMHLDNCPERPQPAAGGQKKSFCFATGGESGVVKIWDSARGRCIASCNVDGGAEDCSQIASLSCSSGGTLMATTADGRILFFSLQVKLGSVCLRSVCVDKPSFKLDWHGQLRERAVS